MIPKNIERTGISTVFLSEKSLPHTEGTVKVHQADMVLKEGPHCFSCFSIFSI